MNENVAKNETREEKHQCYYHPSVETNLLCSNCEKPICPKDIVYTNVGVKCPDCARPIGRMRGGLKPIYYWRSFGFGFLSALLGGILVGELRLIIPYGNFVLALALGYLVGETVSQGAKGNTGRRLQAIAAICAFIAFVLSGYISGHPLISSQGIIVRFGFNPVGLFLALLGIILAIVRLAD
jgi:DNA-directed RNA polymerase subunit RPC12/RpoP